MIVSWADLGSFNTSTSTWTPTEDGTYLFICAVSAAGQTSGNRRLAAELEKNTSGGAYAAVGTGIWNNTTSGTAAQQTIHTYIDKATTANSYQLFGYIDQTQNTIITTEHYTYMEIVRLY